jgi:hypothetical protein
VFLYYSRRALHAKPVYKNPTGVEALTSISMMDVIKLGTYLQHQTPALIIWLSTSCTTKDTAKSITKRQELTFME